MGFGMTFDGQMAARAKQYLQRIAQQQRQDALTATVTAPFEAKGGKPTDGVEEIVMDVATAVKRLARTDKDRTLMAAIGRLHAKRQSNGKPLVYVPE